MSTPDETIPGVQKIQGAFDEIFANRQPLSEILRSHGLEDAAKKAEEAESRDPSPSPEELNMLARGVRNSTLEELERS